jgi:hypothetical protein
MTAVDEEIKALADRLYRDRVRTARRTPPEEKLLDGPRLFAYACKITEAGIRSRQPDATAEDVLRILRQRLAWRDRMERRA